MSSLKRTGLRIVSLGAAAALVCSPMATAPVEAALEGATRVSAAAHQGKVHERRKLKLAKIGERKLSRMQRNKLIARAMMAKHQWRSARQFQCLERLWSHESHWNERAHNGSSGAHGIPQALPGSKMGSAGPNWRSNPKTQIRWGLRYVKNRYGSPCGAWGHFQAAGWY